MENALVTVADYLAAGWVEGEATRQRGYVSRKSFSSADQVVRVAGGSRKGQLYYIAPAWDSTTYSYRQYLYKGNENE